jgi:hypothetical protein
MAIMEQPRFTDATRILTSVLAPKTLPVDRRAAAGLGQFDHLTALGFRDGRRREFRAGTLELPALPASSSRSRSTGSATV